MFRIQLDWAIAIYVSAALLLVLLAWVFYNYLEDNNLTQPAEDLVQCEFCGHLFFNLRHTDILSCPLCHSYVSVPGKAKPPRKKARKRSNAPKKPG